MEDIIIFETRFCGQDIVETLEPELRKKFNKLPEEKQRELIEEHANDIRKGLECGLMSDWVAVMQTAIDCTTLEDDIEQASKE